ncbi:MAG: hypothetical protein ABI045_03180 [Flavobacteriales bacterium]
MASVYSLDAFNQKENVSHNDNFFHAWDKLYRAVTVKNFPTTYSVNAKTLNGKVILDLIHVDFYHIKPKAA